VSLNKVSEGGRVGWRHKDVSHGITYKFSEATGNNTYMVRSWNGLILSRDGESCNKPTKTKRATESGTGYKVFWKGHRKSAKNEKV